MPDPLDHRQALVGAADRLGDRVLKARILDQAGQIERQAVLPGVAARELGVGHDQRHQVRSGIAVDHHLAELGLESQNALDPLWRAVVAAGEHDQVALAIGDLDVARIVDQPDVAGMQPAVLERLGGRRLVAPVALHHRFAAHQDLAIVSNLDVEPGQRGTDRVQPDLPGQVDADHRRALGQAIALKDRQAERAEEQADIVV